MKCREAMTKEQWEALDEISRKDCQTLDRIWRATE
jgi:hypothetical protein